MYTTGCSKETVTYHFSLTGPEIKKNGKTRWFLASLHREVLIFWCLKRVRWKKSCLSELGQNGGLALAWIDITWAELSEKSPKTFKQLKPYFITAQINQKTPPITPKTTPDTRDTNKHCKTSSDTLRRPTETRRTPLKRSQTPSHHLCTTLEGKIIFNLNLLRHQNIKTTYVSFPKIIGFGHLS